MADIDDKFRGIEFQIFELQLEIRTHICITCIKQTLAAGASCAGKTFSLARPASTSTADHMIQRDGACAENDQSASESCQSEG